MATIDDPKAIARQPVQRDRIRRWKWTTEQYARLIEHGFLKGKQVELIEGEILEMSPHNPPHSNTVEKVDDELRAAFGPQYRVRIQLPIELGRRTQPEPDGAVLARRPGAISGHPKEAVLVVEVGDSSLRKDRTIKAHIYARAGIADYWIVNLVELQLEVYRNPGPDPDRKGRHRYNDLTVIPADGHVSPLAAPQARIAVADLLP